MQIYWWGCAFSTISRFSCFRCLVFLGGLRDFPQCRFFFFFFCHFRIVGFFGPLRRFRRCQRCRPVPRLAFSSFSVFAAFSAFVEQGQNEIFHFFELLSKACRQILRDKGHLEFKRNPALNFLIITYKNSSFFL